MTADLQLNVGVLRLPPGDDLRWTDGAVHDYVLVQARESFHAPKRHALVKLVRDDEAFFECSDQLEFTHEMGEDARTS